MARSFHRTFIAGVAAAAVFLTALGASQAQARDINTERAMAALLGLAVVGAIIADRRSDRKSQVITRNQSQYGYTRDDRRHGYGRDDRHHGVTPRALPQRAQRNLLPGECLRTVRMDRGRKVQVLGGRCLQHNYAFTNRLPRQCAHSLQGGRGYGRETVWSAQCLQRNGYRVSRR